MNGPARIVVMSVVGMALFAVLLWITFSVIDGSDPSASAQQVVEQHEDGLLALDGVVGVGVGERSGREVIEVYVDDDEAVSPDLPSSLDGYEIVVTVSGPVTALPDDGDPTVAPPKERGDIRGEVTSVVVYDLTDDDQTSVGGLDVEGEPTDGREYDAAAVTITRDTTFFRQTGGGPEPIGVDLRELEGAEVEVWFTGPVAESYPVQATAGAVLILD